MFLTVITHADARKGFEFRGLTEQGWQEAGSAVSHYHGLLRAQAVEIPAIDAVVSSPKPRCLETAILLAKGLGDFVQASEVGVKSGLKAGSISGPGLQELAQSVDAEHVLVSGHADMVKTLPQGASLVAGADNDGWFADKPVLFTVAYEPGASWDEARVLFCQAIVDGAWQDLMESQ